MKILITGAGGFVGRQLVPALAARGHEVRAASRSMPSEHVDRVQYVSQPWLDRGDVDWEPLVRGVDSVVHLAGIAHASDAVTDAMYEKVNHRATAALALAAERAQVGRFVFVSSIRAQTGPTHSGTLTELSPEEPTDAYGRSKLAAESALASTHLEYTILRPVLIYGPGLKGNLSQLARLARLPFPLPFGSFANRRSLLGIDNFITAVDHVLATTATSRATFVTADPTPISLAELLSILRRGRGRSPWLVPIPRGLLRPLVLSLGGAPTWNRLAGELVASPRKLMTSGWKPNETRAGLERLARSGDTP